MKLFNNTQSGHSILSKSFLSRMVQMRSCFLTTCTNKVHEDKNTKQMSHYAQEKGRSMVEMLGVLAIIGVLSVGGIAGYSKAMFKYKMNQTLDIISHAITGLIELGSKNLGVIGELGELTAQDMVTLGIIPDCDVNYVDTQGYKGAACPIPFGEIYLALLPSDYGYDTHFRITLTNNQQETCVAFLTSEIYKHIPENWWYSDYFSGGISIPGENKVSGIPYMEDNKGLKFGITAVDIADACSACENICDIDLNFYI